MHWEETQRLFSLLITERLKLSRTSGGHLVQPPAQVGPATAACPGTWPVSLGISPRMKTPKPPWATCGSTQSLSYFKKTPNKQKPNQKTRFCSSLCPLPLVLWLSTMEKSLAPGSILFTSPHQIILVRSLKSYSTLSFSLQQRCSSPFIRLSPAHPCLSLLGTQKGRLLQVWPHQCLTEGMDQPLDLLTMILLTQLRILLTFFATGVHLAHIHPGACQDLSCQAASQSLSPQEILVPLPPQVHRTLHSSFLSSRRFLPPTSPACPGSPGWQHSPYGQQPLLPVLCLLGEYSAPSSE